MRRYRRAIAPSVEEILGDDVVSGVRVRNLATDEVSQVDLAGLFVYVGMQPNTAFLKKHLKAQRYGTCADGRLDENRA